MSDVISESEEISKKIGELVFNTIKKDWDKVLVECSLVSESENKDVPTFKLNSKLEKNGIQEKLEIDLITGNRIINKFKKLRELTHKPGVKMWVRAIYTLGRDGKYKMDFVYPE